MFAGSTNGTYKGKKLRETFQGMTIPVRFAEAGHGTLHGGERQDNLSHHINQRSHPPYVFRNQKRMYKYSMLIYFFIEKQQNGVYADSRLNEEFCCAGCGAQE